MVERALLDARKLLPLPEITTTKSADVEELFDDAFYLRLLKESGTATVARTKLGKGDRIVKCVEEAIGGPFDHHRPARHLLEHPELLTALDGATLDRWEQLVSAINARLESGGELARPA